MHPNKALPKGISPHKSRSRFHSPKSPRRPSFQGWDPSAAGKTRPFRALAGPRPAPLPGKSPPPGPQQPSRALARPRGLGVGSGSPPRTLWAWLRSAHAVRPGLAGDPRRELRGKTDSLVRHVLHRGVTGPGGWPHRPVGKEARGEPGHWRRPSPSLLASFVGSTREPCALDKPSGGGKGTAAFALSPERLLQRGAPREGRQIERRRVRGLLCRTGECAPDFVKRMKEGPLGVLFGPVSLRRPGLFPVPALPEGAARTASLVTLAAVGLLGSGENSGIGDLACL